MHAWTAIDLAMVQEDLLDVGGQSGIFSALLAWFAVFPGILAACRDLQRLAEHRDWVLLTMLGKERKSQSWLREKMPSAFFSIARS